MWKNEGIDFGISNLLYRCIPTGYKAGMLEIVKNSTTIASIQGGIKQLFEKDVITNWIKEGNPDRFKMAKHFFARSCAGYFSLF
jgi:phosphatidylinositol kinase/protein kinase (PI-3  family)